MTIIRILQYLLSLTRAFIFSDLLPLLTTPLGWLRPRRCVTERWPAGSIPLGPRVALVTHYERRGTLRATTRMMLEQLADAGFSVVLVSNSGSLTPDAMAALQDICAAVLVRRNIGYDFGAWADAMATLSLPRPDTQSLLICNDSLYGPLAPLPPLLAAMDPAAADMWSLTESWQRRFHLQSFFLLAHRAAITSPAWAEFWASIRPLPSKHAIIKRYEVGLTQSLLRAGLRCRAVFAYRTILARQLADAADLHEDSAQARQTKRVMRAAGRRMPLNPTSDLWRPLLCLGFPFLKRELLRENPGGVIDIADWQSVVATQLQADTDLIERDLATTMRNRAA